MSTTVTFKGNIIATVDNDTATLTTQGKYVEANIILTDTSSAPTLQSKTATPSLSSQSITPDSGYDGLSSVTVNPITGTLLGNLDADFAAENIKKDVNMFGVVGTYEGGGGGGGSTVDIRIVDNGGVIANVIYPPSATWPGFEVVHDYPEGTLTIPTNSMFILTTLNTAYFTCEHVTATKITQTGRSIKPLVYYVYVGTTNGLMTTGGPLD